MISGGLPQLSSATLDQYPEIPLPELKSLSIIRGSRIITTRDLRI